MDVETPEIRQARYRASVKWLLSKAFNNNVPANLREPFYRDHDDQERLKPQIIIEMGNATLYCQTLSNMYADPLYQSLNHSTIVQVLARKGIAITENPDMPLTETVLIQTNPLRINAHMAIIEAIMKLYTKDICAGERVTHAIRRISGSSSYQAPAGQPYEHALLSWVAQACSALKQRIEKEIENGSQQRNGGDTLQMPQIPPLRDFQDLCDGIALALLISYYCPKVLSWTSVRINYMPSVEDSIFNIMLVCNFSEKFLPYSIFHMTPEDITYMRGSMKLNLILLLTDLFNLFEVHPAKCVCYPEMDGQEFVVHKSRGVPTLSSAMQNYAQRENTLLPAQLRQAKEKSSIETKENERVAGNRANSAGSSDYVAAGRPSNWEQNRQSSFAGRRSRRNSCSDDSQLTIENFGGSQDQLNLMGRLDRDNDGERERERKLSSASIERTVALRSSVADARGTLQLGYDTDSGSEKQDRDNEKTPLRRAESSSYRSPEPHNVSAQMQQHAHDNDFSRDILPEYEPAAPVSAPMRKISTGAMSNMSLQHESSSNEFSEENNKGVDNASKLSNILMKLEEKRRRVEQDKRRIEQVLIQQKEKLQFSQHDSAADLSKLDSSANDSKLPTDITASDLDRYEQSIMAMNLHLMDIQQDIQRLASQQSHIQSQQIQAQKLFHAQQIANIFNQQQQQQYGSQQQLADPYRPMMPNFGSTPHISQHFNTSDSVLDSSRPPSRDPYQQQQQMHGYMNAPPHQHHQYEKNSLQSNHYYGYEPPPMQSHRRTWSSPAPAYEPQHMQQPMLDINAWQSDKYQQPWEHHQQQPNNQYHHGGLNYVDDYAPQQQMPLQHQQQVFQYQQQSSPQPHQMQRQNYVQRQNSISSARGNHNYSPNAMLSKVSAASSPPDDMLAPQSICFIGDEDDVDEIGHHLIESLQGTHIGNYEHNVAMLHGRQEGRFDGGAVSGNGGYDGANEFIHNKLNITSGNRTYRIPSPSRPSLNANSFQNPKEETTEKGFYISFDDEQPKRPKPPLRAKRLPNKRETTSSEGLDNHSVVKRESPVSQLNYNSKQSHSQNNDYNNTLWNQQEVTKFNNSMSHKMDRAAATSFTNSSNAIERESEIKNVTYNKYTDAPPVSIRKLVAAEQESMPNNRHGNDNMGNSIQSYATHQTSQMPSTSAAAGSTLTRSESKGKALVIGTDTEALDPQSVDEMERRKEKIMLLSLQRRQLQEEARSRKEIEAAQKREREREKEEARARKKEEQIARRNAILEQHRLKKAIEEAEREGKTMDRGDLPSKPAHSTPIARLRQQKMTRPRPKTIHVDDSINETACISSRGKKGSTNNLSDTIGQRGRTLSRISVATKTNTTTSPQEFHGRKSNSLMNLSDIDQPGRSTRPRRAPSPGMVPTSRPMSTQSGPGSLPPGLVSKRRGFDDGSSDISSTSNSIMEYSGPKLYKQPATKSNRGIILNAVEYCVFPGAVNRDAKQKLLEKIARSEAKHFLVLFRDAGCQFRALYSYVPETQHVSKLYGTGPAQVDEVMFDKFFKYNSGGKCFSQVHTKHLTVTIDAFTIHNSLWQGKKAALPNKKDMTLFI